MEKNFTSFRTTPFCAFVLLCIVMMNAPVTKTYAQCSNQSAVFTEDFGTGIGATSNADVLNLTYQASGDLATPGTYRVSNDAYQNIQWHASEDATPNDIYGRMLVVNGQAGIFYSHQIDRVAGFPAGNFTASLFLMNVNLPGVCDVSTPPAITMRVEYLSEANVWEPLEGSPYTSQPEPERIDPVWTGVGSIFTLPATGTFLVKSIRIVLANETASGCGNDFAIDEIKVSQCSESGDLPVVLLSLNARKKDNGVTVDWATSQELNSKSFVVERSPNGNSNWSAIATVSASGNSSTVKNYSTFDPAPFKGINYYRLKQIDIDGAFEYSKIVSIKLNLNRTGIVVLPNPFHNSFAVDFSGSTRQVVSARLIDIAGKQVAFEKWSINSGSERKEFANVASLQKGIYVLVISNENGEILSHNKIVKQ